MNIFSRGSVVIMLVMAFALAMLTISAVGCRQDGSGDDLGAPSGNGVNETILSPTPPSIESAVAEPVPPEPTLHTGYIPMIFYSFSDSTEDVFEDYEFAIEFVPADNFVNHIIDLTFSRTGIEVLNFWYEGDKLYIDLDESEINGSKADYFDMGSTGGTVRLRELLASFSSLPDVEYIDILIDGEAGIVGNHFNFDMTYTAEDFRKYPLPDFNATPPSELDNVRDYVDVYMRLITDGDAEALGAFISIDGGVTDRNTELGQRVIDYYTPYDIRRAVTQQVFYYEIEYDIDSSTVYEKRYSVLVRDGFDEMFVVDLSYGDGLVGIDVRMIES